jgi:hypothetical protein
MPKTSFRKNSDSPLGTELLQQLDAGDPLLQLASAIPWSELEQAFASTLI